MCASSVATSRYRTLSHLDPKPRHHALPYCCTNNLICTGQNPPLRFWRLSNLRTCTNRHTKPVYCGKWRFQNAKATETHRVSPDHWQPHAEPSDRMPNGRAKRRLKKAAKAARKNNRRGTLETEADTLGGTRCSTTMKWYSTDSLHTNTQRSPVAVQVRFSVLIYRLFLKRNQQG